MEDGIGDNDERISALENEPTAHTILNKQGTAMTERPNLQFTGVAEVSDNAPSNKTIVNIPSNLSAFSNDAGFIDNTVNNLVNYYKKTETYTQSETDALLDDKVDKVTGKQLSTEDFTSALKTKLEGIEAGAQANVQADWNQTDNTADDYIKNKPTIPSGSGHTILDNNDTEMTQRPDLQFKGIDVSDDSTNGKTVADVSKMNESLTIDTHGGYIEGGGLQILTPSTLTLGNNIASGDGASFGRIEIYGNQQYKTTIIKEASTDDRYLRLPDKSGTIATTDDIPTDASDVTYDNAQSGLSATTVQDAIDEVAQGGGGSGIDYLTVENGKICVIYDAS
jgi:hypothetical protein